MEARSHLNLRSTVRVHIERKKAVKSLILKIPVPHYFKDFKQNIVCSCSGRSFQGASGAEGARQEAVRGLEAAELGRHGSQKVHKVSS